MRKLLLTIGLWLGLLGSAHAAIAVTNLGTAQNNAGATITITSATVPSGSLVFVAVAEGNAAFASGTVADGSNTYTRITGSVAATGSSGISVFYAKNAVALSGGTITYTKGSSGSKAVIAALYATGIDTTAPLDTAVTAAAQTIGSVNPSVTSGTPAVSGELLIGAVGFDVNATFTQDSTHGAYSTPPNLQTVAGGGVTVYGGFLVNTTGAKTYSPTANTPNDAGTVIVGFKPSGAAAASAGSLSLTGVGQ